MTRKAKQTKSTNVGTSNKPDASSIAKESKVASVAITAYTANGKTGDLLLTVCTKAQSVFKGEPIVKAAAIRIASSICKAMGWKAAQTVKNRQSEMVAVLGNYVELQQASEKYRKTADAFSFHNAITLARLLNKGKTVTQAVTALKANAKGPVAPKTRGESKAKVAVACNTILKLPHLTNAMKGELRDWADKHGVKLAK